MPLSRLYLGVHSINQVLFGETLGLIFLILYKYSYQKNLYNLFCKFLNNKILFPILFFIIILQIILMIIPFILYRNNLINRPI